MALDAQLHENADNELSLGIRTYAANDRRVVQRVSSQGAPGAALIHGFHDLKQNAGGFAGKADG